MTVVSAEDQAAKPDQELVVGFWTLVILLKLVVILSGVVVLLVVVTELYLVAGAIVLIILGLSLRWLRMYQSISP